jgi:hypothetical protein
MKSGSGWRWAGIAAVLLVAVLGVSEWNKRTVQTVAPGAGPSPEAQALQSAPKPTAGEQPSAGPRRESRARPERERADRPGDTQRPALEEYHHNVQQEFRSADRNGDGYLSREEVKGRFTFIEREFGRVDADGDGRISPDEFWQLRRFQARQKIN